MYKLVGGQYDDYSLIFFHAKSDLIKTSEILCSCIHFVNKYVYISKQIN